MSKQSTFIFTFAFAISVYFLAQDFINELNAYRENNNTAKENNNEQPVMNEAKSFELPGHSHMPSLPMDPDVYDEISVTLKQIKSQMESCAGSTDEPNIYDKNEYNECNTTTNNNNHQPSTSRNCTNLESETLKDFLNKQYKLVDNENTLNELLEVNRESIDRMHVEQQELLESISRVRATSNNLNVQMNQILHRNIEAVSISYAQSLLLASLNSIQNVSTNVINEGLNQIQAALQVAIDQFNLEYDKIVHYAKCKLKLIQNCIVQEDKDGVLKDATVSIKLCMEQTIIEALMLLKKVQEHLQLLLTMLHPVPQEFQDCISRAPAVSTEHSTAYCIRQIGIKFVKSIAPRAYNAIRDVCKISRFILMLPYSLDACVTRNLRTTKSEATQIGVQVAKCIADIDL